MFDCVISLFTQFIPLVPPMVAIILAFNIIRALLWGDK